MADKTKTLSLKAFLDTNGFEKPMAEMRKSVELSGKNFRVAASEAAAFGTSADELRVKQQYLQEVIAKQKNLVDMLTAAHAKAVQDYGAESKAADQLSGQLTSATIKYNKLNGELRETGAAMKKAAADMDAAAQAEAEQAAAAARAAAETTGFEDRIEQLRKEMERTADETEIATSAARAYGSKTDELRNKARGLGTQISQQKRMLDTLVASYEKSKRQTGENSTKTEALAKEVSHARIKYNELNAELRDTSQALTDEAYKTAKSKSNWTEWVAGGVLAGGTAGIITTALNFMGSAASKAGDLVGGAFDTVKQAAQLAAQGVGTLAKGIRDITMDSAAAADDVLTMASKMGLSATQVQEMAYASELVDVDLDTMAGSMSKLTVNVGKAADEQKAYNDKLADARKHHKKVKAELGDTAAAFKTLGVPIRDNAGHLRDANAIWYESIDALGKVRNETERDLLAQKLYGKSFAELKPMIDAGGDALRDYATEAHLSEYIMTGGQLEALGKLDDSYQRYRKTLDGIRNFMGAAMAPAFSKFFDGLVRQAPYIQDRLSPTMEELGEVMAEAAGDVVEELPEFIKLGAEILPELMEAAKEAKPYVIEMLRDMPGLIRQVSDGLNGVPGTTITSLGEFAINSLPAIAQAAADGAPSIERIVNSVANNSDSLSEVITTLAEEAPGVLDALADFSEEALPDIADSMPKIAGGISTIITKLLELGTWVNQNPWVFRFTSFAGAVAGIIGDAPKVFGGSPEKRGTGGITNGGVTIVGERGPEPVILPRGSRVVSNAEARQLLGDTGGVQEVHHSGTVRHVIENVNGIVLAVKDEIINDMGFETRMA